MVSGVAPSAGDPAGPVEPGRFFGQVGEGAQVVGEVGVAALHDVPVRGRHLASSATILAAVAAWSPGPYTSANIAAMCSG